MCQVLPRETYHFILFYFILAHDRDRILMNILILC